MEILFGLLILALIVLGLRRRKKEDSAWRKEERYEESGAWIDKRPGERGAYGSLDEEMEANRRYIARQGRVSELAEQAQAFCFEHLPGFDVLDNAQLRQHLARCKSEIEALFQQAEEIAQGRRIAAVRQEAAANASQTALKKLLLDYCFEHFPALLDAEIEEIKTFDRAAEAAAMRLANDL